MNEIPWVNYQKMAGVISWNSPAILPISRRNFNKIQILREMQMTRGMFKRMLIKQEDSSEKVVNFNALIRWNCNGRD